MARPKTKKELLTLSKRNYNRLLELVNSYSKAALEKDFPKGTMNRNVRDVLAHLHHWHLMVLEWYAIGMKGNKPDMPATGYTWKQTPELNKKIREMYKESKLSKVKKLLDESYNNVQQIIATHSDKELFEKKRYKWTGSTSLGAYLVSNTSSHYDWAFKLIRKSV